MFSKRTTVFLLLFTCYAAFSAWVYTGGTDQKNGIIITQEATEGKALWQKNNCIACHQLYGLGGYLGPDLTHITSDNSRGEQYAAAFIKSGGITMPVFHFTEKEIASVIAYLRYVDAVAKHNNP